MPHPTRSLVSMPGQLQKATAQLQGYPRSPSALFSQVIVPALHELDKNQPFTGHEQNPLLLRSNKKECIVTVMYCVQKPFCQTIEASTK